MPEQPPPVDLHQLAQELRQADHLEPEAQRALADLLEELAKALPPAGTAPAEAAHLAESASQLATALHEQQEPDAVAEAVSGLEVAIARAEAKAPLASGIAHRIIEALANLGI